MKTVALLVRKPGMSRDAFRAHYESQHAPLALSVMSGLQRYVRHHVARELHGVGGFDVVSTFVYRDAAALHGVVTRLASPAGDPILRDEVRFMDKPRNRFFPVREVAEEGVRDRGARVRLVALLRRPDGAPAGAFAADVARDTAPALRDAVRGLRWLLRHEAVPGTTTEHYDAVLQLHADAAPDLAAWCAAQEKAGARVVVVGVDECETPLPAGGLP